MKTFWIVPGKQDDPGNRLCVPVGGGRLENEELVRLIQEGIEPKKNIEQLYLQNQGFIRETARKYAAYSEMDDLCQEGFLALNEAAGRYVPEKGSSFLTFFSYLLRSRFRRYIDNTGRVKRLPAYMHERIWKYRSYLSESAAAGKEPTDPEICQALKISKEQLQGMRKVMYESDLLSIDDLIPGTDVSIGEGVADPADIEADVTDRVAAEELWKIVGELDDEQADILVDRYKLMETMRTIGEKRNISPEKVRSIEDRALRILSRKKRIREIAEDNGIFNSSKAFRGSVGSFKHHGSVTEYVAIKQAESDERIEQIRKELHEVEKDIERILLQMNDGS